MADNTTINAGTGGDIISSDVITTLNGGAIATGEKAQRVKVGHGADGTFNDANASTPLPVIDASATPAGTNIIGKVGIDQTTVGTTNKVAVSDSLGNSMNSAGPGFLKVTDEPRQVFYDPFDATPDTTNLWTSTTGSAGIAASVATGVLSMGTGTTANGYSKLTSIPTFKPVIPGWIVYSDAILIPDAATPTANALRLWGAGTTPVTPTFAAPITDGYFFELSGSTLSAVVYAGGTRTQIATGLTLATTYQRYIIQVRTDKTYFYIGTIDSAGLVATTSFQSPQVQTLPKLFLAVGNSTPPATNSQIQCTGAVVSDTGKNAAQLSDGTFPWRKATVKAASTAVAATDLPLVVGLHPTSPLPAGTNALGSLTAGTAIVGKVGIDQTTPGTTNLVALAANQSVNNAQVNGASVVSAAAGVQKVGVSGATGVTLDAADNATAPTNSISNAGLYSTTIPALTSGNAAAIRLDSTGAQYVNNEGRKATYSLAVLDYAPLASATVPSFALTGSATKTVRISRIGLSATAATGAVATLNLRRLSALSGGTAASQSANITKHDTNNAAATAVINTYSVAATVATSAGIIRSLRFEYPTPAVTVQPQLYEWFFGDNNGQSLVVRGTSDFVGLCFNGIATTPTAEIYIEWTEE